MLNSLVRLYEAVSWLKYERALRKPLAQYTQIMRSLFVAQQNAFIRSLSAQRKRFSEADTSTDSALGSIKIDVDQVFDAAVRSLTKAYAKDLDALNEAVLLQGANAAIADYTLGISFTVKHPRAVEYLKNHGSQLITQVNDTTKRTINNIVTVGLANGDSYTMIEKAIIKEFRAFSVPPKRGNADIRTRAQLVAINETGNAYQSGNYTAVLVAQDTGVQFEKTWVTVGDRRVSEGCKANEAEGYIPLTQDHASGNQHPNRFPGCRCFEAYRRAK